MSASLLKERTLIAHKNVETVMGPLLFKEELVSADYLAVLKVLFQLHYSLETVFAAEPQFKTILVGRSKLAWLLQDINNLDINTNVEKLNTQELDSNKLPQTLAECWGAMYVVEGSTLGGAIITKRLNRHAWIQSEQHLNYFNSYGRQRGEKWQEFVSQLNAFSSLETTNKEELVSGAIKAFNHFERQLKDVFCQGGVAA